MLGCRGHKGEGRRFIAELLARAFPDEGLRLPSRGARETRNFSKQAPSRPLKMLQFCTRVCDFPTEETSWSKKSGTIWIGFMYDTHECGVLCRVLWEARKKHKKLWVGAKTQGVIAGGGGEQETCRERDANRKPAGLRHWIHAYVRTGRV